MTNRNRRSFITTAAAIGTAGLAGCVSDMRESLPFGSDESDTGGNDGENGDSDELEHLPGETIGDFDDLEEWVPLLDGGDLEAETDGPYAGSQSARLTADEDAEFAGMYTTISGGIDLTDRNLSLAVRFTDREQLHLTVELFAPNSNTVHSFNRTLTGPVDRWVRVDLGTTRVDSQTDLSSVQEIRVTARRRGGESGAIVCQVDDLRAVDRPDQGKVLLLFDGTLESHYTHAFEHMEAYDFPGVEAVMPEAIGGTGRLALDTLWTMDEAGWEMVARPAIGAARLPDYSADEQEDLIDRTKSHLEDRGFEDGADHFVTPGNILGPNSVDVVEEYHEQAFRYGGGPNALPITDPHNIGTFSGADGDVTEDYVDFAAEYGQLAVLHFEEIGDDGMDEEAFADLLEHIDDRDVEVVTASDLLDN